MSTALVFIQLLRHHRLEISWSPPKHQAFGKHLVNYSKVLSNLFGNFKTFLPNVFLLDYYHKLIRELNKAPRISPEDALGISIIFLKVFLQRVSPIIREIIL